MSEQFNEEIGPAPRLFLLLFSYKHYYAPLIIPDMIPTARTTFGLRQRVWRSVVNFFLNSKLHHWYLQFVFPSDREEKLLIHSNYLNVKTLFSDGPICVLETKIQAMPGFFSCSLLIQNCPNICNLSDCDHKLEKRAFLFRHIKSNNDF